MNSHARIESAVRTGDIFPPREVLRRLALSDTGFVFDPVSGQSFSASETAVAVLQLARDEEWLAALVEALAERYEATPSQIERDLHDFAASLRELLK